MNDRLEVPKFASEEEEANWWFENRGKLEEEFLEAARTGRLRTGSTALRRAREASNTLTIHLSDSDFAAIRRLAAQRGLDEDACAASILHRALEAETADRGIDRH
jgi:predicted DNA binding CopG/RHH family protein